MSDNSQKAPLDAPTCCASCYLDDKTTAGEMMRWINEEFKQAGKNRDHDMLAAVSRLGDGLETAWQAYRSRHNTPEQPPAPTQNDDT